MSVKVVNKLPAYKVRLYQVLDDAVRETSLDILIKSKNKAPYGETGDLRADTEHKQIVPMKWRVSYFKEYARFQEFGGDSTRRVRNYTTPGTGKAFLKSSGDQAVINLKANVKKHSVRARV